MLDDDIVLKAAFGAEGNLVARGKLDENRLWALCAKINSTKQVRLTFGDDVFDGAENESKDVSRKLLLGFDKQLENSLEKAVNDVLALEPALKEVLVIILSLSFSFDHS